MTITNDEIQRISQLSGWTVVERRQPTADGQHGSLSSGASVGWELYRQFDFPSFESAMHFMQLLVPVFTEYNHHPRWENQYKAVHIFLTTWDAEYKVTAIDVKLAEEISRLFDNRSNAG